MICWSCERGAGDGPLCSHCGALLPPQREPNHFQVLGLPRRYDVDLKLAEEHFRALSRQFHPDRFATADPRARRASLQRTVQLNEAWRTMKDPVRRAEYLLQQAGFQVGAEEGASRPQAKGSSAGGRERIPVPAALLGEILDLREELGEARQAGDQARVQRMAGEMRHRADAALQKVATSLAEAEASSSPAAGFEVAVRELIAIRYFRRFLDEVSAQEDADADAAAEQGEAHA
ncbi:MAG: Fe-S protein assembly co-chaperone HscB [Myxococcales bacterium]